jgi:GlpG protein
MRRVARLKDTKNAARLSAILAGNGIENQMDAAESGDSEIWVLSDERIPLAKEIVKRFEQDPEHPEFKIEMRAPNNPIAAEPVASRHRVIGREDLFRKMPITVATGILVTVSIIVTLITNFGASTAITDYIAIAVPSYLADGTPVLSRYMPEVQSGEIWRLVTPIFLHLNFLHLLFNMLMLRDIGTGLEKKHGPWKFLGLVVLSAVISNVSQFMVSGPAFGGMSGVLFGLFGYAWIRSRMDPFSGIWVSSQSVVIMIAWFFLCLSGIIGNIANTAHFAGAVAGIIIGAISAMVSKRERFRAA